MPEESNTSETTTGMFADVEDSSWMRYPSRILESLFVCILAITFVCVALIAVVPLMVFALLKFLFSLRARVQLRNDKRAALRETGRTITYRALEEHAARREGIVISDFEGFLWWSSDAPKRVAEIDLEQRSERRFVRLYQIKDLPEEESDRIADLSDALWVDISRKKLCQERWERLARETGITMLSLQFKN